MTLDGFGFDSGDHLVIFGPNGAGKSSLLRRLIGFGDFDPILNAAYLPQKPYAFRGTAELNLTLGLTETEAARAMDLADGLGVSGVLASEARVLSGGELQRLNLARVLARSEEWVILDEPLAPLDVRDRERVAGLIAEAIGDRGSVIVTHHRESAAIFGDKVVVVVDGAVAQQGPIREVFSLPASEVVAAVVGVSNVLSGEVQRREGVLGLILAGDLEIWARTECDVGDVVKLLIPAESVTVFASGGTPVGSARNRWDGVIGELRPAASLVEVLVEIGRSSVVALVTQGSVDGLGLAPSVGVTVAVKASAVRAIGR